MGIVYTFECRPTGMVYVGCSEKDDAKFVKKQLERNLNHGIDWCKRLSESWTEFGAENFVFTVVQRHSDRDSVYVGKRELWDTLNADHTMFNARPSLNKIKPASELVDSTLAEPTPIPTMTEAERRMELLRLMDPYKTRFVEGENGVPIMVYDGEMPTLSTPEPVAHGSLETEDDEDYEYDENTGERVYSSKR